MDYQLGKYIEYYTHGKRKIKRIKPDIASIIRKHKEVYGIGYIPGTTYKVSINIYSNDPKLHQQIIDEIGGNAQDFVFFERKRNKSIKAERHQESTPP